MSPPMKGIRPGKMPSPSQTSSGGRWCVASGCETRLSIYNHGTVCWQHAELAFPNYRGKRLAPQG
jgi:hypothetical protein